MSGDGRLQPAQAQSWLPDVPFDISNAAQNLLAEMKGRLEALYTDPTPPGAPTGVTATNKTLGNLLQWNAVPKAAGYRIYRGTTSTFSNATLIQELKGVGNVSWYDSYQAAAASGLYYWVTAINAAGIPGPTGPMVTISAGINVNDIFAQNITATGTITGATLQTSNSNPRIVIDSVNGLRSVNAAGIVVLVADLAGNVGLTGTLVTAGSGSRIEIDPTNGFRAYSGSSLITQIPVSGSATGSILTTAVTGEPSIGSLLLNTNNGLQSIALTSALQFSVGGTIRLNITSTQIAAAGSAAFTGDGSGLTTLNASNVSSGTLATGRLPTDVVKYGGSAIAGNIAIASGYGIAFSGTSVALATNVECYTSSTLRASFGSDTDISVGGTKSTISLGAADSGGVGYKLLRVPN